MSKKRWDRRPVRGEEVVLRDLEAMERCTKCGQDKWS
jgi:hypothetical protein